MKRMIFVFIYIVLMVASITCEPAKAQVVASTSWVAAFVRTAGIEDVVTLAPVELTHPPEYELKPSDLILVSRAAFIVFAGYEKMAEKLRESAAKTAVFLKVTTRNDPVSIRTGVLALAEAFGTVKQAEVNLKKIETFFTDWKNELKENGYYGKTVICHAFQEPLIQALDFSIAGLFGPAPPEVKQIVDLTGKGVAIIIDNYHNPVAKALTDSITGSRTAVLINFPTLATGKDLLAILARDRDILAKALGEK
jgi:hypothetical protein